LRTGQPPAAPRRLAPARRRRPGRLGLGHPGPGPDSLAAVGSLSGRLSTARQSGPAVRATLRWSAPSSPGGHHGPLRPPAADHHRPALDHCPAILHHHRPFPHDPPRPPPPGSRSLSGDSPSPSAVPPRSPPSPPPGGSPSPPSAPGPAPGGGPS